jgi:hypothetical protein
MQAELGRGQKMPFSQPERDTVGFEIPQIPNIPRQRVVLSAQKARQIFEFKRSYGSKSANASSIILGARFGVSAKTIRDIWSGRTWLDATSDLWGEEERRLHQLQLSKRGSDSQRRIAIRTEASSSPSSESIGNAMNCLVGPNNDYTTPINSWAQRFPGDGLTEQNCSSRASEPQIDLHGPPAIPIIQNHNAQCQAAVRGLLQISEGPRTSFDFSPFHFPPTRLPRLDTVTLHHGLLRNLPLLPPLFTPSPIPPIGRLFHIPAWLSNGAVVGEACQHTSSTSRALSH